MTQSSMSFVRDKMLTQQKPPVSEVGAVRWVRENLFSSPLNGFLTLISLYVVYWIIASSLPWFLNGVWTANSLGECRQIIEANAGPGAEGACWAILRERWHQFLFGFYPMDAYWRPVLAFGLMLMALAPALYYGLRRVNMLMLGTVSVLTLLGMLGVGTDGFHLLLSVVVFAALFAVAALMPKKLLWLTLVYPLVGFYLLWGGSVWGPVGVAIGFGLLAVVWNLLQSRLGAVVAGGIAVAVALIW